MKNRKSRRRDGVYERNGAFWISWTDAGGQRRRERTYAATAAEARSIRHARLNRVERSEVLGFTPPADDTFADVAQRFLTYQCGRLTPAAYQRVRGLTLKHLIPAFPRRIA